MTEGYCRWWRVRWFVTISRPMKPAASYQLVIKTHRCSFAAHETDPNLIPLSKLAEIVMEKVTGFAGRYVLLVTIPFWCFSNFVFLESAVAEMILFSEVNGVVTKKGKPVHGAEVRRSYTWNWNNQKSSETTVTDGEGRFSFPVVAGSSFLGSLIPHEPIVSQAMHIYVDGKEYDAWIYRKDNYNHNGELDGKPIELICDLDESPDVPVGEIYGICRVK